jgi:CRISPR-associated exonuclease Cas4
MMGDRDYRQLIEKAIDSIGKDIEPKVEDPKDANTIYLHEVVRCLRRSYYDRTDPLDSQKTGFGNMMSGLLQKMKYGGGEEEFAIEEIKLKGRTDMIVDDAVFIFRSATELPDVPLASDILFLNACQWIFNKNEGLVVYITPDGKEGSFSLTKDKKMFEEIIRRVRVLNDLIKEKKVPIIEPSIECSSCQYYERCYIKQKLGQQIDIHELFGMKKSNKNIEK